MKDDFQFINLGLELRTVLEIYYFYLLYRLYRNSMPNRLLYLLFLIVPFFLYPDQ